MKKPSNIGIWIEEAGASYNQTRESCRAVCILIGHFLNRGIRVTVALPGETENSFRQVLTELGVRFSTEIKFITVGTSTPVERLKSKVTAFEKRIWRLVGGLGNPEKIKRGISLLKILGHAIYARNYDKLTRGFIKIKRMRKKFILLPLVLLLPIAIPIYLIVRVLLSFLPTTPWQKKLLKKVSSTSVDVWYIVDPNSPFSAELEVPLISSSQIKSLVPPTPFNLETPAINGKLAVERYCKQRFSSSSEYDSYLCDFPFSAVDYLFVTSQFPFWEDMVCLLQAYEILLRRRRRNIKLIMTANHDLEAKLRQHLVQSGLVFDVLVIQNPPYQMLKEFFRGASLTIIPSIEGGFPLDMTESLSTDTPVVIAHSAVTSVPKMITLNECLYDPLDAKAIARTIEYCLDHHKDILKIQQDILNQAKENWDQVTEKILNAYDRLDFNMADKKSLSSADQDGTPRESYSKT
jgi:hypothetical protein